MNYSFVERYAIAGSGDSYEVQNHTSFLSDMTDGKITRINCTRPDDLVETCVELHGQPDEPTLYFSRTRRMPWFRHFKVNREVLSDPEDTDSEIIDEHIIPFLAKRNILYRDYYELDVEGDSLITHIYSYDQGEDLYIILVSPALSHVWNEKYRDNVSEIQEDSILRLPVYRSSMSYWGSHDGQNYRDVPDGVDDTLLRQLYEDLFDPERFHILCDSKSKANEENLTLTLIDLLDDNHVMQDINMFRDIGVAYLNCSQRSVPYAMHRWTQRFKEYLMGDDTFKFPDGSLSLLDMRDHLNKSRSPVSWKTMEMYLRRSDYHVASKWHQRWMKETDIDDEKDHYSVAQLFYKLSFSKLVFSPSQNQWYIHDGVKWTVDYKECYISDELPTEFRHSLCNLVEQLDHDAEIVEPVAADKYRKMATALDNVIGNLLSINYIMNIVKASKSVFMNSRFSKLLDADPDVLNTPTCIIQFVQGQKPIIRKTTAEDYVSKVTSVRYNRSLNEGSQSVMMANDLIDKLFPDPDTKHEVMKILCYLAYGGNRYKKFFVMTGPKDTGKSTFKKFLSDIFSSDEDTGYARDVPISVLSREPKQGAPAPELVQCDKARIAVFTEPDDTVSFNNGTLKAITGGDSFFARGLYQSGGVIKSEFKLILQCNKIPPLMHFDRPTLERFVIIPFETLFTTRAPTDPEEQRARREYPLNPDFYKQNDLICEGLFWLMLNYTEHLDREGITLENSSEMLQRYNSYVRLNNKFADFVDHNIRQTDSGSITEKIVFRAYRSWYKTEWRRNNTESDEKLRQEFNILLGESEEMNLNGVHDRVWRGYTIDLGDTMNNM